MAKEHVEYSMIVLGVHGYKMYEYVVNCNMMCDIDNNWVMLLFTSCMTLTLSLDLLGGMGTCEANPSQL